MSINNLLVWAPLLLGVSCASAVGQPATKCSDLQKLKIDHATLSEAVDVPATRPS